MFIPREPVLQNQFCQFAESSNTGGVGGVLAYAGSVCYMLSTADNNDAIVKIYSSEPTDADERIPFGFLMQKVKAGYHQVHPPGFFMPGDLGSSDVVAQPKYNSSGVIAGTKTAPVGVAHLGIWDTVHYMVKYAGTLGAATVTTGEHMKPGQRLYVCDDSGGGTTGTSKITNQSAANSSYGTFTNVTTVVARVLKGGSAAQCQANINNTTLFPVRVKLLV